MPTDCVVWALELRAVDARTRDAMQITALDGTKDNIFMLTQVNYP